MDTAGGTTNREEIRQKLKDYFPGKIVRKDLTKKIKEGANVPVYVLEFLLGQYCSSDDEEIVKAGVENVKKFYPPILCVPMKRKSYCRYCVSTAAIPSSI